MKIIDLFAGAGGLSEGFRRNGTDIVAHVEKDVNASLTLKTREGYYYCLENNKMDLYIDYIKGKKSRAEFYRSIPDNILNRVIDMEISDENYNEIIGRIDTLLDGSKVSGIIGGPPCQAYSIAGRARDKNKMKNDPRNFLYKFYLRFVEYYNPQFFLFENVLGLLSAYNGDIFKDIQREMNSLGYDITCNLLDSCDFGVLQSRKRVIISGWKNDLKLPHPIFKKERSSYTINDLFKDLPRLKPGKTGKSYKSNQSNCLKDLKIRDYNWSVLTYHTARALNSRDAKIYAMYGKVWNNEKRQLKYNELPIELITHKNLNSFLDRYRIINGKGISHTIVAHIAKDGHHYIHPDVKQCRSISVREAARIQTFPDNYFFESSRTSAFQQIGNAVPPLMADKLCQELLKIFSCKEVI
ncbi:MAG: DNA cytosine methyltransferase [Erysipelotrichaceae bacterium]